MSTCSFNSGWFLSFKISVISTDNNQSFGWLVCKVWNIAVNEFELSFPSRIALTALYKLSNSSRSGDFFPWWFCSMVRDLPCQNYSRRPDQRMPKSLSCRQPYHTFPIPVGIILSRCVLLYSFETDDDNLSLQISWTSDDFSGNSNVAFKFKGNFFSFIDVISSQVSWTHVFNG